jgi:nitrite reductase/ring-hydroxylating ferredoxin subunit
MAFVKAASLADVPPGKSKQVTLNNRNLALFNVGGVVHAIDDTCPHRGAPLWEGDLNGAQVTCPWHGAIFDVTTGRHLCPPAQTDVAAFKVQIVGQEIQVDMPG